MNNYKIAVLAISACLLLGACNTGNGITASNASGEVSSVTEESEASAVNLETHSETEDKKDELEWFIPDKNFDPEPLVQKEKSAHDCITDTYAEADLVKRYIGELFWSISRNRQCFLEEVNLLYPIQYLHRTDKNSVYAVYKTKEGGMYYMFFHTTKGELPWATDNDDGTIGYYSLLQSVYMTKTLSHGDFSGIQIGDPISKVKALEPAVGSLEEINSIVDDGKRYLHSMHILTDGLLCISYEAPEGEELRVTQMSFHEDFTESYENKVPDWGTYTLKHNLKIAPEDYPK